MWSLVNNITVVYPYYLDLDIAIKKAKYKIMLILIINIRLSIKFKANLFFSCTRCVYTLNFNFNLQNKMFESRYLEIEELDLRIIRQIMGIYLVSKL